MPDGKRSFRQERLLSPCRIATRCSILFRDCGTKRTDLRVKVHAETKVVEIDGVPYPLSGSDEKKERMVEFIQALINAEGSPVSAKDYKLRSRDVEGQHDKIKTLIGDDAKPGSGYRIPREKLMA